MTNTAVPTALYQSHGYSLYRDDAGKPFVIRKWTTHAYEKDEDGVRTGARCTTPHECRLDLTRDSFAALASIQAMAVFQEVLAAWDEWTTWQEANGKG